MANLARTPRADSAVTRERILDASEALFSERGYSGTSLRAIADAAGVNLAAANYHFGSKASLLEAAFQRCMAPINAERLRRLDELEAQVAAPSVEAIVRVFVGPGLEAASAGQFPRLLARIFAEPKELSIPLIERTFAATAQRYLAALAKALPQVEPQSLIWRFHFMVGCLVHLVNFAEPPNVFGSDIVAASGSSSAGPEQLIDFAVAGICQELLRE